MHAKMGPGPLLPLILLFTILIVCHGKEKGHTKIVTAWIAIRLCKEAIYLSPNEIVLSAFTAECQFE